MRHRARGSSPRFPSGRPSPGSFVPGLAWVFDKLLRRLDDEDRDMSEFFGPPCPGALPLITGPGPLRRSAAGSGAGVSAAFASFAVVMFAGAVNQASVELWVINRRWHVPQPEPMRLLSLKLRFLQGWFMFSPNPVMDDGTIIVDAITVDGRHLDPFTGQPPNFDLMNVKSYGYSQIWCDYLNRIHLPANTAYRDQMRDYMLEYKDRTGHPNDAIEKGDVYWVQDLNPKWGETKSWKYEKIKLFSFEAPKPPTPPSAAAAPHAAK